MHCRMTGEECKTPSMCAPFGGCRSPEGGEIADLRKRVERLERLMERVCPDKSDDI